MRKDLVIQVRNLVGRWTGLLLLAGSLFVSHQTASAKQTFIVDPDNSIVTGDLTFATMNEYFTSDYFRENGMRCGAAERSPVSWKDSRARALADCTLSLTSIQDEYWLSGMVIQAPVWFHVIHASNGEGNVSETAIRDQLDVLNEDYRAKQGSLGSQGFDTRVQFSLAGITRTENDQWFNDFDRAGYLSALQKDPTRYVNVYVNTAGGYLGYATYPQEGAGVTGDGIVVNYATVGGRDNGNLPYDQGRTLVHEMGHYLGLFHTFEGLGSCSDGYSSGDLIVDTPSEQVEHYTCINEYSCETPDPIHNYMNYTPDSCMIEFTREQANRIVCSLVNYRPGINIQVGGVTIPPLIEQLLLKSP